MTAKSSIPNIGALTRWSVHVEYPDSLQVVITGSVSGQMIGSSDCPRDADSRAAPASEMTCVPLRRGVGTGLLAHLAAFGRFGGGQK